MLLQSGMQARRESGSPTDIEDWVEQADEQGGGTLWKSAASQMGCAVGRVEKNENWNFQMG